MTPKNSEVDVLIVGAGAAGSMAALCAVAYGMNVRIIDKRPQKLLAGHGDGIHSRMMEILDTFGLAEKVMELGNEFTRSQLWSQDANGTLIRETSSSGLFDPPSPFTSWALSQAKMADVLLDSARSRFRTTVERGSMINSLSVEEDDDFPVKAFVRTLTPTGVNGEVENNDIRIDNDEEILAQAERTAKPDEIIRAKYLIACDGAHSWMRRNLGIPMIGDDTDAIWGVMDLWPITDFPGARVSNSIQGRGRGLMWIPRERGMIRIYTVVGEAKSDEHGKMIRSSVTPENILKAANEILHPYKLAYKHCEWWAAYQIGQRVAVENIDPSGRIFLAGDAVHTHSPQAGQGLNVSMADTYNLMWKMNLVLKGRATPELLQTYRQERLILGQQLVDYDRQWAAIISGREPPEPPPGIKTFKVTWESAITNKSMLLVHGLQVNYPPSAIITSPDSSKDASPHLDDGKMPQGIVVGMRMPSYQVRRHADHKIVHLGKTLRSDGRFRFVIFAGDTSIPTQLEQLNQLSQQIQSLRQKYRYPESVVAGLFDAITIHTADASNIDLLDFPDICHPFDPELGYDYGKTFYDENIVSRSGCHIGSAYKKYEVDPKCGLMVLLRPDGYVAHRGGLDDFKPVRNYFEGFLLSDRSH